MFDLDILRVSTSQKDNTTLDCRATAGTSSPTSHLSPPVGHPECTHLCTSVHTREKEGTGRMKR